MPRRGSTRASLFTRLLLLLGGFGLLGHVLALTLMFSLEPPPAALLAPPTRWHLGLLLDLVLRLALLGVAAWIAARWLSRRVQERDEVMAAVSHDLRTPLTRLRLRAESLDDERQRDALRRDVADMDRTIQVTLDHLLGRGPGEQSSPIDVAQLAQEVAADWQALGKAVSSTGQAEPLLVQPVALARALDNLVDNALRYAGHARIEVIDSPTQLRLCVLDNGPGIPAADRARLILAGQRGSHSARHHARGRGLGLALAQDVARQHGGSLSLLDAPGGGLLAQLSLPRSL